jgi:glycosyltransferase involved in cell wall biosynthesis
VRVLIWHGWLLEGSGSNVAAARLTEALRRAGHDVLLLSQAPGASAPEFIDAVGTVGEDVSLQERGERRAGEGRAVLLRPDIGSLLPVFVADEYEGFTVKRFVDLTAIELETYVNRNVNALRTAVAWHRSDLVVASHLVPGGVIAARALRDIPYVAYTHGSELAYAVEVQARYADLARAAMDGAAVVAGGSHHVLARALAFAPTASVRGVVIAPGVDVEHFRPRERAEALEQVAILLEQDPDSARGRPAEAAGMLASVVGSDPEGPERLAHAYDQNAPDVAAASRLQRLARAEGPTVAFLGKLIPQKGVELFVQALALLPAEVQGLIIGFGLHREWLEALVTALGGRGKHVDWIRAHSDLQIEVDPEQLASMADVSGRLTFTGRLDHRYAPMALAGSDVLVVPSVIPEAFAMVTVEGAAAGCLPMVARHSGLAEVAEVLETHVGRLGIFGFEPGPGAVHRLAEGIRSLLSIPPHEREELRRQVSSFARSTWTWDRMASQLVEIGD